MFNNLIVYMFAEPMNLTASSIEQDLEKVADRHCASIEKSAVGWERLHGGNLVHSVQGHKLLKMRLEEKILPASVIKREVLKKCATIEKHTGRKPGSKEKRDMKEEIEREFLPRAFTRESTILVWIDQKGRWLGIDASSSKKCEIVIEAMLENIKGMVPLRPISTKESPASVMRQWLTQGEATNGFEIDTDCELVGGGDVKSTVRYSKHSLGGQDVAMHLEEGKLPSKLGISFDDAISFVFDEHLTFKKIQLIGFEEGEGAAGNSEDTFDATFFAKVTILSSALEAMLLTCGGEAGDDMPKGADED